METQFQSLITARTWVPESVQKYSHNMEHHHVISKARLQLQQRIYEYYTKSIPYTCLDFVPKDKSLLETSLVYSTQPFRETTSGRQLYEGIPEPHQKGSPYI